MCTMRGILDRFEGDLAVILIEEAKQELVVDKTALPPSSEVNTVFDIVEENGHYKIAGINQETTRRRSEKSSALMDKLRAKKRSSSKFKRK